MTSSFHEKVHQQQFGIVTFGVTPPKKASNTNSASIASIAAKHRSRCHRLQVDAIVMNDLHDESDRRTVVPRPFPFRETVDGVDFARAHLMTGPDAVAQPLVHFRCLPKVKDGDPLTKFVTNAHLECESAVFVGAASSTQSMPISLSEAYRLRRLQNPSLLLGAVAIPERHTSKGDEPTRMLWKQQRGGVSFFITQCVYSLQETKMLLCDYQQRCAITGTPMVPILVTLAPCGSLKTLELLRWLGVSIPTQLSTEMMMSARQGKGILETSVEQLLDMFKELVRFAVVERGIPLGCNIESITMSPAEIDAAVGMVTAVREIFTEAQDLRRHMIMMMLRTAIRGAPNAISLWRDTAGHGVADTRMHPQRQAAARMPPRMEKRLMQPPQRVPWVLSPAWGRMMVRPATDLGCSIHSAAVWKAAKNPSPRNKLRVSCDGFAAAASIPPAVRYSTPTLPRGLLPEAGGPSPAKITWGSWISSWIRSSVRSLRS